MIREHLLEWRQSVGNPSHGVYIAEVLKLPIADRDAAAALFEIPRVGWGVVLLAFHAVEEAHQHNLLRTEAEQAQDRCDRSFQGEPIHQSDDGTSLFIPLPKPFQEPSLGGCSCTYCKAHPDHVATRDTLVLANKPRPDGNNYTHTVHFPDLKTKAALWGWPIVPKPKK